MVIDKRTSSDELKQGQNDFETIFGAKNPRYKAYRKTFTPHGLAVDNLLLALGRKINERQRTLISREEVLMNNGYLAALNDVRAELNLHPDPQPVRYVTLKPKVTV